jgi:hypothetical protein
VQVCRLHGRLLSASVSFRVFVLVKWRAVDADI